MKAVILAAGQGTRLMPHTAVRPKCLIPLNGRSLLDRQLSTLRTIGVRDIAVVAGYRASQVRAAAQGCRVFENPDYETTNMVTSLMAARSWLESTDDVIVTYGDIVFEPRVARRLADSVDDVAVVVDSAWRTYWEARMANPLTDAETLRLGPDGLIREVGAVADSYDQIDAQYIGLSRIAAAAMPRVLKLYDSLDRATVFRGRGRDQLHMTDLLQLLIEHGLRVHAVSQAGGWLEVDTVADLELYARLAREDTLDRFCVLD